MSADGDHSEMKHNNGGWAIMMVIKKEWCMEAGKQDGKSELVAKAIFLILKML